MNTIREIQRINDEELERGLAGTSASWHSKYLASAWVYVGNLDHQLSEGDVLCVLSQYGELEDIHLARDDDTGKSKGFAFCKYEDARSCVLAVDNLTGAQLCGRSLRVDHVENYRLPKNLMEKEEDEEKEGGIRTGPGHAYEGQELGSKYTLSQGQDLFAPPPPEPQQPAADKTNNNSKQQQLQQANDDDDDGDSSINTNSSSADSDNDNKDKKKKRKRKKEDKQRKRIEKEERKRQRDKRREERVEKRRMKRAKKVLEEDDGGGGRREEYDNNDEDDRRRKDTKKRYKKQHHHKRHRHRSRSRSPR